VLPHSLIYIFVHGIYKLNVNTTQKHTEEVSHGDRHNETTFTAFILFAGTVAHVIVTCF